jgi:hypothetical protein
VSRGSKVVKLVDGTKILDKWTEVDLSSLGSINHLELHMEATPAGLSAVLLHRQSAFPL